MARVALTVLCFAVLCAPASAAPTADWVAEAVTDVPGATAQRYAARDDRGATVDGLKVIRAGKRYLGVYHSPGAKAFDVHLATSTDLLTWTRRATLDTDGSQATIARAGTGFVVAYEKALTADVLPLTTLPPELDVANGLLGRVRVRLRYYPTLARLLTGNHARQFTAPRTIAFTAEGTPHIERVVIRRGIARSRIELGIHHFADLDGDVIFPEADRQGTAVLTDFRSWKDADAPAINDAFARLTSFHAGFDTAPVGNIGDRDRVGGVAVHEAQYRAGEWATWRLFLRDVETNGIRPLEVRTHGGSRAFGNPSVTWLRLPDGRRGLFASIFVFSEDSAPGEPGALLLYRAE